MADHDAPRTATLDLFRWVGWAQMQQAQRWLRERGISHEQGFVLGYLGEHPGAIQREITEVSRTTAASVSSLLKGLEQRGLIERRPDEKNQRVKRVYATPAGAEVIAGFDEAMRSIEDGILAPLTPAERTALHTLLTKLTAEMPRPTRDEPSDSR